MMTLIVACVIYMFVDRSRLRAGGVSWLLLTAFFIDSVVLVPMVVLYCFGG